MNLFYQPLIPEGVHFLDSEESRHCIKVLRRKPGDALLLTDGKGFFYEATITGADLGKCTFAIHNQREEPAESHSIHIALSPTKNHDRLEWFVEKAVELGIDRITPLNCRHTERKIIKTDRLVKVAVSAMKQSLRARLPHIDPLTDVTDFIRTAGDRQKFIAHASTDPLHLQHAATAGGKYTVLIGPEGDFTDEELQMAKDHGFIQVSLGVHRLRTETAALAACHILNLINITPSPNKKN